MPLFLTEIAAAALRMKHAEQNAANSPARYGVTREAEPGLLASLPTDLANYYTYCFDEAKSVYDRCDP